MLAKVKDFAEHKFSVRILKVEDVSEKYVNWFSDEDVVRFSDNQYRSFNLEGQKEYVMSCLNNKDIDLYGIFSQDVHIGNIAISGLLSNHRHAEITYVIGDRKFWNCGAATFAITEIVTRARNIYRLCKLYAGIAEENHGSRIVLERNGFVLEGIRKSHLLYNQVRYDQLDFGLVLQH